MKINVYAIYDVAAAIYKSPFMMRTDGEALRGFMDLSVSGENEIGKHPEQFQLFKIGVFDDGSGLYSSNTPTLLATAQEMVAESQRPLESEPVVKEVVN
jgi:hypothetical protein